MDEAIRFDGVTSMIYLDHGLGRAFSGSVMGRDNALITTDQGLQ